MRKHKVKKIKGGGWDYIRTRMPRWGFDGLCFFDICREACINMTQAKAKLVAACESQRSGHKSRGPLSLESLTSQQVAVAHECIAVTFAAMCLEACIWDYAACNKSKRYTENHLDKLDFVSKWVVIPELLCGTDITKVAVENTCLLEGLRNLRKARNALVHPKSKPTTPANSEELIRAINPERAIAAKDALHLIRHLLGELEKVDKTDWWFFKTDEYRDIIKRSQELMLF